MKYESVKINPSSILLMFCAEFNLEEAVNYDGPTTTKAPPKVVPKVPTVTKAPVKPKPKPGERMHPFLGQQPEVLPECVPRLLRAGTMLLKAASCWKFFC